MLSHLLFHHLINHLPINPSRILPLLLPLHFTLYLFNYLNELVFDIIVRQLFEGCQVVNYEQDRLEVLLAVGGDAGGVGFEQALFATC